MFCVVGSGFEPLKAEPADLQSAPIGRSGNPPELLRKTARVLQAQSDGKSDRRMPELLAENRLSDHLISLSLTADGF